MRFNENWLLEDDFGLHTYVNIPYDAMFHEKRNAASPNGTECAFFDGKKYRFTKEFEIDSLAYDYAILFESVYQKATIYLNSQKIFYHFNGFTEFKVELNGYLKLGKNILTVEADNTLTPNCRWYTGGGILRQVHFIKKERDEIQDVRIHTLDAEKGLIEVVVDSKTTPLVSIYEGDTLIYQGKKGILQIPNAKLWDDVHPNLYLAKIETEKDAQSVTFGIRTLEVTHEKGLLVNGKKVLLKGACVHSDNGLLGMCSFYDAEYNKVKALKDAGFNAIRCAHNPCSRYFLEVCDKLGMYVIDELYDTWYTPKTYHDQSRAFSKEQYTEDIQSVVQKDYNHPSVIFYSIGNEISELAHEKGLQTCHELVQTFKAHDPTRLVTCGVNLLICVYEQLGLGVYREKGPYKAEPQKNKKIKKQKKTGSTFFNMMVQKLGAIMFLMSSGKQAEKIAAKSFAQLDLLGLNYGSSRYKKDAVKYKDRIMFGSETMAKDLAYNWSLVEKYNCILGDFVWAGVEYLGEAGFGDWTYYSYKGLPITSGSGVIDLTLHETAELNYMQVIYSKKTTPVIALRPLNHAHEVPYKSAWRFTDAIVSYNFNEYENCKGILEVYAYAAYVKLLINSQVVGFQKLKDYRAIFQIQYKSGIVEAIAYDEHQKEVGRSTLKSGNNQKHLKVTASKYTLHAHSEELSYIDIEFVDSNKELLPCVEQPVSVELQGDLELVSFGSALGTIEESYFDVTHHSYRGRALLIVKSNGPVGPAFVIIRSKDVKSKKIEIKIMEE